MDEKKFLQDVKLVSDRSVLVIVDMENELCTCFCGSERASGSQMPASLLIAKDETKRL